MRTQKLVNQLIKNGWKRQASDRAIKIFVKDNMVTIATVTKRNDGKITTIFAEYNQNTKQQIALSYSFEYNSSSLDDMIAHINQLTQSYYGNTALSKRDKSIKITLVNNKSIGATYGAWEV